MSSSHTKTGHSSKASSCCFNHLPLPSASHSQGSPLQGIAQLSCTRTGLLQGLRNPMFAPLFLQSYTALLPRPHLLKLVDLPDEEVPIASSNLCVRNMDHVLGKEQREVRKRTELAGRPQALPNMRSHQSSFAPALVQHHIYPTCAHPTATIQLSVGCLPWHLCLG